METITLNVEEMRAAVAGLETAEEREQAFAKWFAEKVGMDPASVKVTENARGSFNVETLPGVDVPRVILSLAGLRAAPPRFTPSTDRDGRYAVAHSVMSGAEAMRAIAAKARKAAPQQVANNRQARRREAAKARGKRRGPQRRPRFT